MNDKALEDCMKEMFVDSLREGSFKRAVEERPELIVDAVNLAVTRGWVSNEDKLLTLEELVVKVSE